MGSHLDGLLPEYHPSFNAPHHYMMQGTRSVDSGSPWHETPLPFPTLASKLSVPFTQRETESLTEFPLIAPITDQVNGLPLMLYLRLSSYPIWHSAIELRVATATPQDSELINIWPR